MWPLDDTGAPVVDTDPGNNGGGGGGGTPGGSGYVDTGSGGGGGGPTGDAPDLTAVDPGFGTNAGGTSVTISGGPFDGSTTVHFGTNAATVTNQTPTSLVVSTPSYTSEGPVDVKVTTSTGSNTSPSGFTYYEDGSGKAGVVGAIEWYEYAGNYWSGITDSFGSAWATFIVPEEFEVYKWYAASSLETCESDYTSSAKVYVYDLGVSELTLTGPAGSSISLPWDASSYLFQNDELNSSGQYYANGSYDLEEVTGSSLFPDFQVSPLVETPSSFNISSPAITGNSPITLSRSQLNFSWTGSDGDYMIIQMSLYNSAGTGYDEVVTCAVNDDGSFSVPSSAWSNWTSGRQVTVLFGRAKKSNTTLSFNNSENRVVGLHWLIAAFMSQ